MLKRKNVEYSHAETLIWNESEKQLYTAGARKKGAEISKVGDYYHGQELIVLKPVKPLIEKENKILLDYFKKIDDRKYQNGNFLAWIGYLKTMAWLGGKSDKKLYCYEMAARMANEIGRWPKGKSLGIVSIFDLMDNKNYK